MKKVSDLNSTQGEKELQRVEMIVCGSGAAGLIALSAKQAGTNASTQQWQTIAIVGKWKGHMNGPFELKKEDLDTIVLNFKNSDASEIVCDYEHATLYGERAPASGWIKDLKVEQDTLQAQIEWLDSAKASITSGEYKYLSPVLNPHTVNQVSGEDIGWSLHSVALTNKPFFEELDEVRINKTPIQNKENTVDPQQLAELEALKKENEDLKAENLKLKDEITAFQKSEASTKIDTAVAAKKIHPDQKESLIAFSLSDPAGFDKFLETAKVMAQAPGGNDMFAGSQNNPEQQKYDVLKLGGVN